MCAADGTYDANYAICQPDNVPCPVTFFTSDNMLGETPETTGWNETINPFEESVAASQNASFLSSIKRDKIVIFMATGKKQSSPWSYPS